MQKLYNIVKVMLLFVLLFTQNTLQAQKCCVECQADVKVVSDKQVLLEKIDLKAGTLTTNVNTNLYVSYRSGNTQKFWTNLVIATAGVAVSTQLNNGNLAEGKSANGISPLLPLGVSVATLPSIWKNRPRGVPQAGLYIIHRDTRGKLLDTWEQPISSEAKNDAELLTVSINKPLLAGTLEVYLQNGSKNSVYYWGYETNLKSKKNTNAIFTDAPVSLSVAGCPSGYLPNGNGMCCNFFNGECVSEGGGNSGSGNPPTPPPSSTPTGGGCPSGYLPNGQGMCCSPFTGQCVSESRVIADPEPVTVNGGGIPGVTVTAPPYTGPATLGGFYPAGGGTGGSGVPTGSGGNGGSGGNSPNNTEIKTSEITVPCLVSSLNSIVNSIVNNNSSTSFQGLLNAAFGSNGNFKITFRQAPALVDNQGNNVAAQTGYLDRNTNSIDITLNTSMLPGTSSQFQKFTILHELMHAYLQTQRSYPSHEQMLGIDNFLLLYNAVRGLGISRRDTFALILYGSKDAEGQPNYEATLADYNNNYSPPLTKADIQNIGDSSSKTTTDTQGNKSLGGGDCR